MKNKEKLESGVYEDVENIWTEVKYIMKGRKRELRETFSIGNSNPGDVEHFIRLLKSSPLVKEVCVVDWIIKRKHEWKEKQHFTK